MDKEYRRAKRIYTAVVIFLATAMLTGSAYLNHIPVSF